MRITEGDLREILLAASYADRMGNITAEKMRDYCESETGDAWENAAHLVRGAVGRVKSLLAIFCVEPGADEGGDAL